ncbi:MAG: hypothetical protein WA949_02380, partial [Phormidesmis sp.]
DLKLTTLRLRSGFGNGNLRWLSVVEAKAHRSAKAAFIKSSFLTGVSKRSRNSSTTPRYELWQISTSRTQITRLYDLAATRQRDIRAICAGERSRNHGFTFFSQAQPQRLSGDSSRFHWPHRHQCHSHQWVQQSR